MNLKEAKKSVEELYKAIFSIRESLQDAVSLAQEAVNISQQFGGEIPRVITDQINRYFIPTIINYIDDEDTPGAMTPLVTFLDSVPLAMTRMEPQPEHLTPAPVSSSNVTMPPAEGSYASQVQENWIGKWKDKRDDKKSLEMRKKKGMPLSYSYEDILKATQGILQKLPKNSQGIPGGDMDNINLINGIANELLLTNSEYDLLLKAAEEAYKKILGPEQLNLFDEKKTIKEAGDEDYGNSDKEYQYGRYMLFMEMPVGTTTRRGIPVLEMIIQEINKSGGYFQTRSTTKADDDSEGVGTDWLSMDIYFSNERDLKDFSYWLVSKNLGQYISDNQFLKESREILPDMHPDDEIFIDTEMGWERHPDEPSVEDYMDDLEHGIDMSEFDESTEEKDVRISPTKGTWVVKRKTSAGSSLGEVGRIEDSVIVNTFPEKELAEYYADLMNRETPASEKEMFGTEYYCEEGKEVEQKEDPEGASPKVKVDESSLKKKNEASGYFKDDYPLGLDLTKNWPKITIWLDKEDKETEEAIGSKLDDDVYCETRLTKYKYSEDEIEIVIKFEDRDEIEEFEWWLQEIQSAGWAPIVDIDVD